MQGCLEREERLPAAWACPPLPRRSQAMHEMMNQTHKRTPSGRLLPSLPLKPTLRPFQRFFRAETSGGVVLLACAIIALIWANSPWAESYSAFWHTPLTVTLGGYHLGESLEWWINDGLMALFFFVVGLELKREVLGGELASPAQAVLPIAAAVGGMVAPALIYTAFNLGKPGAAGWGIPMATDIAFSLGVLALLGNRIPTSLKVFLTALAVVDDLGAVLVIAVFYNQGVDWISLVAAVILLLALLAVNAAGVRRPAVYGVLGLGVWLAILLSGVHATIAGVLVALTIPSRALINREEFLARGRAQLKEFAEARATPDPFVTDEQQAVLRALEQSCEDVEVPSQRMEHALHPWVAFAIMPLFALANAGVSLGSEFVPALTQPVGLGVLVGLVVGKQLGITLFSWLAVKTGLAALPAGLRWSSIYGAAWLGGIGFTMSLFIADLAFDDASLLAYAKVGILSATLLSGCVGWTLLRLTHAAGAAGE